MARSSALASDPAAATARPFLAVDFGGTKLAAGIVDATTGRVLGAARRSTPVDQGAEASLILALDACDEVLAAGLVSESALLGIGISFGGPVAGDQREIVRSMHVGSWEGATLPDMLSGRFGLPAAMENDANAAALAEARHGAGSGASSLFYVQASTGVGAGIVLDGRVYRGRGGAGELGHVVVDPSGTLCGCGNRGCLETVAAGWAIARAARKALAGSNGDGELRRLADAAPVIDAELVIEAARRGDELASRIVGRAFSALGDAIADAMNLLDPELIVVGGGIAGASDMVLPVLRAALAEHVVPHLRDPQRLVLAHFGANAPLIGAALAAANALALNSGESGR